MKFVLKKRTPESPLGRIRDITIDGAQAQLGARRWSRPCRPQAGEYYIANLRIKMLAENKPDKRATHALVFQGINGLTLRGVEVDWDGTTRAKWGSALVLPIFPTSCCRISVADAQAGGSAPAILKENVRLRGDE